MSKPYRVSRELGRSKPEISEVITETISEEDVEKAELSGKIFSLIGYEGDASKMVVGTSDLYDQIIRNEETTGMRVVGLFLLEDGTVEYLLNEE